ncbi:FAD-binding oxidoreductase, partial [Escherichia coli]|uniref:FAD-binding oxidoreductase n=1 Tax=Escherichia coli TaxID=562 RepID=UPI0012D01657
PEGADTVEYLTHYRAMNDAIYGIVRDLGGTFSAEHGIGSLKREQLIATQPAIATDLMRRIKDAFDPAGIMNPGKMI